MVILKKMLVFKDQLYRFKVLDEIIKLLNIQI